MKKGMGKIMLRKRGKNLKKEEGDVKEELRQDYITTRTKKGINFLGTQKRFFFLRRFILSTKKSTF